MQNTTQYRQDEKIDPKELFRVLKKRKNLIWFMTILFTLFSLVYIFISTPVYEVKAMIQIGQVDEKPIDDVNNIKQKLIHQYDVNSKDKRELPIVKAISVPKKSTNIFALNIHANNNEEGIKYIQTVINKIETEYQEKTDAYEKNQKELIKLTKADIEENIKSLQLMKKELSEYNHKIITLKSEDAALAGIYALQIGQKNTELQELKKYISTLKAKEQVLKLSISPLVMSSTHVVGEIETLENPIKPKKALILIAAFITGLMFSIFLAFFLEFLKGVRNEETEV